MCVTPNPWNEFLRSEEAQGLTMAQRKRPYAKWKKDYMAMVDNDPVAFRAVLCMGKKPVKNAAVPKGPRPKIGDLRKYVAGLRERMDDKEVVYVKECDIRPGTIESCNKLIPTNYAGTMLTTCENSLIGRLIWVEDDKRRINDLFIICAFQNKSADSVATNNE